MYTDIGLRLATAEVTPNGGASPGGLGAASVTLGLDPSGITQALRTNSSIGDGNRLQLAMNITTGYTSGTFGSTLEIQLVSIPLVASLLTNATTSGKTLTITSVALTDATDSATVTGHNLPVGTPVFITSLASTTGIANSTIYYVVPLTANTFGFATTRALAIAGTVRPLTTDGTATLNIIPTIHASTGGLPLYNAGSPTNQGPLRTDAQIQIPIRPLTDYTGEHLLGAGQTLEQQVGSPGVPDGSIASVANRYYYLRYIPSATITAGALTADLVLTAGDPKTYAGSGFKVI